MLTLLIEVQLMFFTIILVRFMNRRCILMLYTTTNLICSCIKFKRKIALVHIRIIFGVITVTLSIFLLFFLISDPEVVPDLQDVTDKILVIGAEEGDIRPSSFSSFSTNL